MQCLKKANSYYEVDHGRFQVLKSTLHMTLSEGWRKIKGQNRAHQSYKCLPW